MKTSTTVSVAIVGRQWQNHQIISQVVREPACQAEVLSRHSVVWQTRFPRKHKLLLWKHWSRSEVMWPKRQGFPAAHGGFTSKTLRVSGGSAKKCIKCIDIFLVGMTTPAQWVQPLSCLVSHASHISLPSISYFSVAVQIVAFFTLIWTFYQDLNHLEL